MGSRRPGREELNREDHRQGVSAGLRTRELRQFVECLSGASAAVSTTGSGSQGPAYSSRRARADVSRSRQMRAVVVIRDAFGFDTWSRSAACQAQVRLLYGVLGIS